MSNKIPLSAIVIYNSKAENKFLAETKKSVGKFSQLILFDVGDRPIIDFAKVRNEALKRATNKYVFFIDSDEMLSQDSLVQIKKVIDDNYYDLVSVVRSDYFLGKKLNFGEAGSIHLVRFGKKDKIKFIRQVHETVEIKPIYKVTGSNISLLHYSHPSITQFFSKISHYSSLESRLRNISSINSLLFELLLFPPFKFIFNYLIRQGYRDGIRGFIYAFLMSLHSLFVRINLVEKRK
ncbi:MAG: glycosyltransferase [Candidatus Pacebacteria bacterium]|nr:glycosyltransferase [Candidatus Paceibacterota bacterium]